MTRPVHKLVNLSKDGSRGTKKESLMRDGRTPYYGCLRYLQ